MTHPNPDSDRDVNAWLDSIDDVKPSAQLQRMVAEIPLRHPRPEPLNVWWPFTSGWKSMVAAALVCALGVIAGASSLEAQVTTATVSTEDNGVDLAFALSLDEELTP